MPADVTWVEIAAADPRFMLVAALLLEPLLGEARGPLRLMPHPVRLIGALILILEQKLNRPERTDADRRWRGLLVVLIVGGVAGLIAWGVEQAAEQIPFGGLAVLGLIISLLAQRSLYRHVDAVGRALATGGLAAGRGAVAEIVGRDVTTLDEQGVVRAAIESCAENFSDAVVAPCFWCMLFGVPGLVVYKAVNTMDSMIGHRNARYAAFGMVAARLDDAMNLIPARLSGCYLALASLFVQGGRPAAAMRVMRRDARKHRSPNAGWPEAAMAGALGLALSGPRRYADVVAAEPWIGEGTPAAVAGDIPRALSLFVVACLINVTVTAAVAAVAVQLA
jgi:adenosylcobinamide-phosphate synthase